MDRDRAVGIATMLASGASNQVGAGLGALAFPAIGPVGVVAVREFVAGAVLLVLGRPCLRRLGGADWAPIVGLDSGLRWRWSSWVRWRWRC